MVLGHSLGGINAYQLATRHPGLVRALVVEGHTVHATAPDGFAATVSAFPDTLKG